MTGRAMHVAASSQTSALGSAIVASVLAGAHQDFTDARRAMTSLRPQIYAPDPSHRATYDKLYGLYRLLHDSFGGLDWSADLSTAMKTLIEINYARNP